MVEIGGHPLLWHILKIYSSYGYNDFVFALGYKSDMIKNYFLNYYKNFSIHLRSGSIYFHGEEREDWDLHFIETGLDTQTGGRIKRLKDWVNNETFMLTYGDGVANVDISKLLAFHGQHGRLATVTAVHAPSRFGGLLLSNDTVEMFKEKQQKNWINGGFFVFEPEIFEYIKEDSTILEQEPLEILAGEGQLMAYRHEGFWQCMDTLRDVNFLQNLWETQKAPWVTW